MNADEPAFPMVVLSLDDTRYCYGLTKREAFAMSALQGLLSLPSGRAYERDVVTAVRSADALLAELAKETK